ncbi:MULTISPECIES: restriction endonuclease [unclassified Streptomyces]|uniref:restriction endonuclease n=1 Tax=unclassified Streptomyces TaxID=2593676 RepID=UPI00278C8B73|nr:MULTISPECIES: restriction endonuclease [unclassified Streptomyces]
MRRPPARRPRQRRRRPTKRQQRQQAQFAALLAAAVVAFSLLAAIVNWLLTNWWLLVVLAVAAALAGAGLLYRRQQRAVWEQTRRQGLRYGLPQLDGLHHREFEYAIRDLMRRDGCTDAKQVGGAGDNGADVLATDPLGRKWVIQCKHRRNGERGSAVGTPDLQRVNGTARQLYGADVVLVVTNGRFSTRCAPLARQLRMHLADRSVLAAWAAGSRPLWELLPKVPPPRRPTPLS